MKKFGLLMLLVTLCGYAVGCGGGETETTPEEPAAPVTDDTTPPEDPAPPAEGE